MNDPHDEIARVARRLAEDVRDKDKTPLGIACDSGSLDIVEILVNAGAVDVGSACVEKAAKAHHHSLVHLLLSKGIVSEIKYVIFFSFIPSFSFPIIPFFTYFFLPSLVYVHFFLPSYLFSIFCFFFHFFFVSSFHLISCLPLLIPCYLSSLLLYLFLHSSRVN